MSSVPKTVGPSRRRSLVLAAVAVLVVAAMCYDTKIVRLGSGQDASSQEFSPDKFGQEQFPRIQDLVTKKAVEAQTLGAAVLADKAAAAKQYGVESTTGVIMPVRLVGLVGEGKSGVYDLKVEAFRMRFIFACKPARRSTAPICAMRPATSSSASSRTRSNIRTPVRRSTRDEEAGARSDRRRESLRQDDNLVGVFKTDQSEELDGHAGKAGRPMSDVPPAHPDAGEVVLAARNIAKSYGSIHALKGVNFDIHRGQVTRCSARTAPASRR